MATPEMNDLHEAITIRLAQARAYLETDHAAVPMSVWEDGFTAIRRRLEEEVARHCEADLKLLNLIERAWQHAMDCDYHGFEWDEFMGLIAAAHPEVNW